MRCVKCGTDDSSVVDSRGDGESIRRRRACQQCGFRFTTYERMEMPTPMVVKKDGRREPFSREKVRAGLSRACEKRPVSMEQIEEAVSSVEKAIAGDLAKEVPSQRVGDLVMNELRRLDEVAYVRFASVYMEFSDVSQFVDTLEGLRSGKKKNLKLANSGSGN